MNSVKNQLAGIFIMFRKPRISVVLLCGATVLLFIWGIREIQTQRFLARDSTCRGRLAQLRLALNNYHYDYGSYPPACIKNENGDPIHSWRVLILPYIDHPDLYKQYDFNEPWNGPNNTKLAESISESLFGIFRSPNDFVADFDRTSFLAVVDKCEKPIISHSNLEEGSKIVLVEVHNSGIHWMEPRDLSINLALSRLEELSEKQKRVNFLTTDGLIGTLSRSSIKFTRNGRGVLKRWLPNSNSHLEESKKEQDK